MGHRGATGGPTAGRPPRVGLLLVDLDRFKQVNDIHGHAAGDELLREVATRLSAQLRPGDLIARLGGDEFAVLLPGPTTEPEARAVADRLAGALLAPFALAGATAGTVATTVTASASIGVAVSPDHGTDPDALLRAADAGMCCAKASGRPVAVFSPADRQQDQDRCTPLDELRRVSPG